MTTSTDVRADDATYKTILNLLYQAWRQFSEEQRKNEREEVLRIMQTIYDDYMEDFGGDSDGAEDIAGLRYPSIDLHGATVPMAMIKILNFFNKLDESKCQYTHEYLCIVTGRGVHKYDSNRGVLRGFIKDFIPSMEPRGILQMNQDLENQGCMNISGSSINAWLRARKFTENFINR